ncbi:MAG: rod shape-determining protein MreC [Anaerolinea sp.]|nr:rod shape-determining protein MreC [Anaerolinea sp.]HRI57605.1 rod shape-determining protein MreC [Anaerolineae bacterium]
MLQRPRARRRIRWWPIVIVLLAAAVVLLNTRPIDTPRDLATRLTLPIQRLLREAGNELRSASGAVEDSTTLRERAEQLEKTVAQLTVENLRLKEIEAENVRLRSLLQFRDVHPSTTYKGGQLVGRIVANEPGNLVQSILIDIGSNNGIEAGMPVVTELGLVGRVTEVYSNAARVLLITDSSSNVNTMLQNTRLRGILRGRAGQSPIMDYLPQDQPILVGDIVVTSGEGGRFPIGIPVGQVVEVEQNDVEMFQQAIVRTTVDFDTLETVLVVTNFVSPSEQLGAPPQVDPETQP